MFDRQAEALRDRLLAARPEVFALVPPARMVARLDAVPPDRPYGDPGAAVTEAWTEVRRCFGPEGFAALQAATMAELIRTFRDRAEGHVYTGAVLECFARSYRRILARIAEDDLAPYRDPGDLLLKDLALCRQTLFPAGPRVVEPQGGIARRLAFRGGPRHVLRFAAALATAGGAAPWYRVHVHLEELEEFDAEGWRRCCLRLADMLEANPKVRGICGCSWFYDPAIARVSPHLSYQRDIPAEGGAVFLHDHVDKSTAPFRSATRRALHDAGRYTPRAYAMLWPRRAVLAWAARTRGSAPPSPTRKRSAA